MIIIIPKFSNSIPFYSLESEWKTLKGKEGKFRDQWEWILQRRMERNQEKEKEFKEETYKELKSDLDNDIRFMFTDKAQDFYNERYDEIETLYINLILSIQQATILFNNSSHLRCNTFYVINGMLCQYITRNEYQVWNY